MTRRFLPGLIIALGLFAVGVLVAFTVGRYPVTLAELIEVLGSRLAGRKTALPPAVENVVLLVRGPATSSAPCCTRAIRSWCWSSPASSLARCSAPASAW